MPVARLATLPGTYGRSLTVPLRASRQTPGDHVSA
jgi:hypothetical protein